MKSQEIFFSYRSAVESAYTFSIDTFLNWIENYSKDMDWCYFHIFIMPSIKETSDNFLRYVFWFEGKVIFHEIFFFRALHNGRAYGKRQYKKKERRISGDLLQGTPRCLDWSRARWYPISFTMLFRVRSMLRAHTRAHVRTKHAQTIKLTSISLLFHESVSLLYPWITAIFPSVAIHP